MKKIWLICVCCLLVGCAKSPAIEADVETGKVSLEIEEVVQENPIQLDRSQVCYGTSCRWVEVADTREERMLGLMMREELPSGWGMWFKFEDEAPNRKFWMKNTLIPLDMIWTDSGFNIVHIETAVPICTWDGDTCPTYGPDETESMYVLEVNSGVVRTEGLQLGDRLLFND